MSTTAHIPTKPHAEPHPEPVAQPLQPSANDRARVASFDQDALLHALSVLDFDPAALATELNVSPFALLDFLESDDVQSSLDRFKALERQMLQLRSFKSRRRAIESLEHVLETTEDLVEKRRTATTLLRTISSPFAGNHPPTERELRASAPTDATSARNRQGAEPPAASARMIDHPFHDGWNRQTRPEAASRQRTLVNQVSSAVNHLPEVDDASERQSPYTDRFTAAPTSMGATAESPAPRASDRSLSAAGVPKIGAPEIQDRAQRISVGKLEAPAHHQRE